MTLSSTSSEAISMGLILERLLVAFHVLEGLATTLRAIARVNMMATDFMI